MLVLGGRDKEIRKRDRRKGVRGEEAAADASEGDLAEGGCHIGVFELELQQKAIRCKHDPIQRRNCKLRLHDE